MVRMLLGTAEFHRQEFVTIVRMLLGTIVRMLFGTAEFHTDKPDSC